MGSSTPASASETDPSSPQPARLSHQTNDIAWIHREKKGLLGNEPGTGKSRSAIEAFDGGNNLVVAPGLVIDGGTWEDELNRWSADPEKWTVVPYSMLNARGKGPNGGTVPLNKLRPEYKSHWDAVIVDEAHYTKGRKTSWTWAVDQVASQSDHVLEMTGTPISNWAHDLFPILKVLNPNETAPGLRFGSFWRWAEDWFDTAPTRFSQGSPVVGEMKACRPSCLLRPPEDPCEHYMLFASENLGSQFRRVLRSEVLDLPPVTDPPQIVRVPMSTDQKRIYRELKKDYATDVDDQEILTWSVGSRNVALDLVTVSPWLLNPVGPPRGGKFEALRFDLESRVRPTFVVAHNRSVVEAASAVAESVGLRSAYVHGGNKATAGAAVKAFKRGDLDVLVGSLETVSEGLTLTVADQVIFIQQSWKPSRNKQAMFRIHRLGQTRACTIREYVTAPLDVKKRKVLAIKNDRQMRVLTAADFKRMLD